MKTMMTSTQRLKPTPSSSLLKSSDHRPTVVLCSSRDDHLLSQDICTLCGSLGKSDEGNLISCSQCGQCYHPYCVNIKVLEVVVSKGWRCLECTVCETCGQPGDEAKLMLCDECELSFHTYCLDPPLEDVPQGSWKCHWCVVCQKCGANTPDIKSDWQKNNIECGPCSSLTTCPKLEFPRPQSAPLSLSNEVETLDTLKRPSSSMHFNQNDIKSLETNNKSLVINDISTNENVDLQNPKESATPDQDSKVDDELLQASHLMIDGVYLSETGFDFIKSKKLEPAKRQRAKRGTKVQKLDDNNLEESNRDDDEENKLMGEDKVDEDGRKKRVRKLSKVGIGGFIVRQRGVRINKDDDFSYSLSNDTNEILTPPPSQHDKTSETLTTASANIKPKRIRKKPKKKTNLIDQYPSYLQEAFFGKDLLSSHINKAEEDTNVIENEEYENISNTLLDNDNISRSSMENDNLSKSVVMIDNNLKLVANENNSKPPVMDDNNPKPLIDSDNNSKLLIEKEHVQKSYIESEHISKPPMSNENSSKIQLNSENISKPLIDSDSIYSSPHVPNEVNWQSQNASDKELNTISQNKKNAQNLEQEEALGAKATKAAVLFANLEHPNLRQEYRNAEDRNKQIQKLWRQLPNEKRKPYHDKARENRSASKITAKPATESIAGMKKISGPPTPQSTTPTPHQQGITIQPNFVENQPHIGAQHAQHSPVMPPNQCATPRQMHYINQQRMVVPTNQQYAPNSQQVIRPQQAPIRTTHPQMQQTAQQQQQMTYQNRPQQAPPRYHNQGIVTHDMQQQQHPRSSTPQQMMQPQQQQQQQQQQQSQQQAMMPTQQQIAPQHQRVPQMQVNQQQYHSQGGFIEGNQQIQQQVHPNMHNQVVYQSNQHVPVVQQIQQQTSGFVEPHTQQPNQYQPIRQTSIESPGGLKKLSGPLTPQSTTPSPHPQNVPIQQGFVENQQHIGIQQAQHSPVMQTNQCSTPRQMHYVNQQRMVVPNNPQYSPSSQQLIRPQQPPIRAPHPQMQQMTPQQQMSYQNRPQSQPRYSNQSHVTHDMQQQHHPRSTTPQQMMQPQQQQQQHPHQHHSQQQPMMSNQQHINPAQHQRVPQMQVNQQQYNSPSGFIEPNQQVQPQQPVVNQVVYQTNQNSPVVQQMQHQTSGFVEPHVQQQNQYQPMRQSNMDSMSGLKKLPGPLTPQSTTPSPHPQNVPIQQGFVENQQHIGIQQAQHSPVMQTNQCSTPRQMHYVNQQRMVAPNNQQYAPNNQQLIRSQQTPIRVGHPQMLQQQQPQQILNSQPEPDDPTQLLEDEDDLMDLGADFNILEYADPETEKSALTSAGKNNIELDPELEDYPFDTDAEERRLNDQMLNMNSQQQPQASQIPQQQQQVLYSPQIHQQHQQQSIPIQQNFVENQQHTVVQQSQQSPVMQPNQCSTPRQMQYVNQQRMVIPNNQQYAPNSQQLIRPQQPSIRNQHPQMQQQVQQQLQMTYQNRPQQAPPRYHNQGIVTHDMQQQQHPRSSTPQQMMQPQQQQQQQQQQQSQQQAMMPTQQQIAPQHQRVPQMQVNQQQYHSQGGFIEGNQQIQQQQQVHPNMHNQYVQQPSQQQLVYSNPHHQQHNQQMNVRRMFQPQPQPQPHHHHQHQQQYNYQNPQQSNYQMVDPSQQHLTKTIMVQDKNPIVGEAITSMEFSMYQQGSGSNNEAVNLPLQSNESSNITSANQEHPLSTSSDNSNMLQNQSIPYGTASGRSDHLQPNIMNVPNSSWHSTGDSSSGISSIKQSQEALQSGNMNKQEPNFKYSSIQNVNQSGRMSSCSNSQDIELNTQTSQSSNSDRVGSHPQNQLLKQLLGNCSSADNPPSQEVGNSSSILLESSNKTTMQNVNHGLLSKQINTGIPNISFQLDSSNKGSSSMGAITIGSGSPTISNSSQIKGSNMIASSLQPQSKLPNKSTSTATVTTTTTTSNLEIKTYNVAPPPIQPSVNLNITSTRVQAIPPQITSIIHKRAEGNQMKVQVAEQTQTQQQFKPQENQLGLKQSQMVSLTSSNLPVVKKVKTIEGEDTQTQSQSNRSGFTSVSLIPTGSVETIRVSHQPPSAVRPVTKTNTTKRKNDYIAERRAALEKEKTPPPREVKKPKGRVRGPNKRSRGQIEPNEDARTVDSNSNTSEDSQQLDSLSGPQAKKLARMSHEKMSKHHLENSDMMFSSLGLKISRELPSLTYREPELRINYNICSIFGCGDLNIKSSKLRGSFGKAVPVSGNSSNFSIQRGKRKIVGYYHEEFPKDLDKTSVEVFNQRIVPKALDRNCDSPDSIISGSSSDNEEALKEFIVEATIQNTVRTDEDLLEKRLEPEKIFTPDLDKFMKFKPNAEVESILKESNEEINNAEDTTRSMSPSIPIGIKLPMTDVSSSELEKLEQNNENDNNKENLQVSAVIHEADTLNASSTPEPTSTSLSMRLRDHENVSVTFTLADKEVDGVRRVFNTLSKLIDYPIQPPSVIQTGNSTGQLEENSELGASFRLLLHSANHNQSTNSPSGDKDIRFNEQSYMPLENNETLNSIKDADVNDDFCVCCKTKVVEQGIRKSITKSPGENVGELALFCSVHCYTETLRSLSTTDEVESTETDDKQKSSTYTAKAPPGLPPMSPMMEDDDDDISNNNRLPDLDKSKVSSLVNSDLNQRKKWADAKSTKWTPSYFDLNKSTSPIKSDEIQESTSTQMDSQPYTAQLINQGDSSVDSNESDNSTCYSQSTGGKLESFCNPDGTSKEESPSLTAGNRYNLARDATTNKDVIAPWPYGMDLIQVRPIRSIQQNVVIKKEPLDNETKENNSVCSDELDVPSELIEMYPDRRRCVLCHEVGDGETDGPARLLNLFIDRWVHLNCALWSLDVYELRNGGLMNVELACKKAMTCVLCNKPGATLKCFKPRCPNYYHFLCATKERCAFYEDKSIQCRQHSKSTVKEMTSFVVKRRVYVNRDEQKQIAEMIQGEQQNVMRIGSLVFYNIGQLFPHQLQAFHDQNNIFPVGYKIVRFYWSYRQFNKRCKYLCTIEDNEGKPQFRIIAQEIGFEDEVFVGDSAQTVWRTIIDMIVDLRKEVPDTITTYPAYIRGEDLFGLTDPNIVRILESLPGVEALSDYDFKFGRSPLLELPLAINPTGCARTEPKLRNHFKRPYTIRTASSIPKSRLQSLSSADTSSPYIKQFVHSKSSQYRKMKSEWRNNVVLARSRVQGLGLYAARDIEKHTMVIEYIGMLIRNEIAERYERIHEAHNRGIYMFRLDEDRVIDATLAGGLARYINHSCDPNCVAEAVEIDRERKILIIANRKILKGEELGYDYKLAIEDDQHKISCLCGAPSCKKWMN